MNPWARCMMAVGKNLPAAALLFRVSYWMPKARVIRAGKHWIAKTREEWCEETGLTAKQVRAALECLKTAGLIEIDQKLFAGKNVTHLCLTPKGESIFKGGDGPVGLTQDGPVGPTPIGPVGPTHIQGDTTESYDIEISALPGAEEKIEHGKEPEVGSVKDFIATHGHKPLNPGKPGSVTELVTIWREGYVAATDKMAPTLTMMEQGNLKNFAKLVGVKEAPDILRCVAADWLTFAKQAQTDAGLKNVPVIPNLDFLLKHKDTAKNMGKEPENSMPVLKKAPKPVKLIAPQPKSVQEAQPTLEELLEINNSSDD